MIFKTMPLLSLLFSCYIPLSCNTSDQNFFEVPFDFEHNQIILKVIVKGKGPFNMILDTGGYPSAVDLKTAREISLLVGSEAGEASGVGKERVSIYPTVLPKINIGDMAFTDIDALALDLSGVADRLGRDLHGVLGYSFLKENIVQIDYRNQKVRFFKTSPFSGSSDQSHNPDRVTFPLKFRKGRTIPVLEGIHVNGLKIRTTLDTGSSLNLDLLPSAIQKLQLDEAKSIESGSVVGARGESDTKSAMVELAIDHFEFDSIEATLLIDEEDENGNKPGANLGNGILKNFVLTLDYVNEIIVFEK